MNWCYIRAHIPTNRWELVCWVLGKYFLENLLSSSCQVHLEQKWQNDRANRIKSQRIRCTLIIMKKKRVHGTHIRIRILILVLILSHQIISYNYRLDTFGTNVLQTKMYPMRSLSLSLSPSNFLYLMIWNSSAHWIYFHVKLLSVANWLRTQ